MCAMVCVFGMNGMELWNEIYGNECMEWNGMYVWNLKELAISSPVHSFHAANLICMRRAM